MIDKNEIKKALNETKRKAEELGLLDILEKLDNESESAWGGEKKDQNHVLNAEVNF